MATVSMDTVTSGLSVVNLSTSPYLLTTVQSDHVPTTVNLSLAIIGHVLCVIGLIGNLLVIVIMVRPRFRKMSTSIYLLALAAADATCLILRFRVLLKVTKPGLLQIKPICLMAEWLRHSFHTISAYILVLISIERVVIIFKSVHIKSILRRKVALMASTTCSLLVLAIIGVYVLGGFSPYICEEKQEPTPLTVVILSALFYAGCPSIIIVVGNIIICVRVYRQFHEAIWTHLRRSTSRQGNDYNRITGMLIINSLAFVLLTVPQFIVWGFVNGTKDPESAVKQSLLLVSQLLDTVNHSMNPLLYTVSGSLYRQEMLKVFRPKSIPTIKGPQIEEVYDSNKSHNSQPSAEVIPQQVTSANRDQENDNEQEDQQIGNGKENQGFEMGAQRI